MANTCNVKITVRCLSKPHAMEVNEKIVNFFNPKNGNSDDLWFEQPETNGFFLFNIESMWEDDKVIIYAWVKWMLEPLGALMLTQYLTNIAGKVPIEIEYAEIFTLNFGQYSYDGKSLVVHWLPDRVFEVLPPYFGLDYVALRPILKEWGKKEELFEDVDSALCMCKELFAEKEQELLKQKPSDGEFPAEDDSDSSSPLEITTTLEEE